MQKVKIYTDGACSGNPGPGGWAAILIYKDTIKEISGGERNTTNNIMELTAIKEALKALKVEGKILIIANTKASENGQLELAARNLPNVKIILPSNLNVKDLLEADSLIMTEAAILEITERLSK